MAPHSTSTLVCCAAAAALLCCNLSQAAHSHAQQRRHTSPLPPLVGPRPFTADGEMAVSDLAQVQAARARRTPSPIYGPRDTVTDSESDGAGVTVTVTSMMAPSQSE